MTDFGRFDLTSPAGTLLPPQVAPQSGYFTQGLAIDNVEKVWYVSMLVTGGVQLPGEPGPVSAAQRSLDGDIYLARLNAAGVETGHMYLKKFGHGQTMGVEHDPGGGAFIWIETDSNLDGPFGTGRKVARIDFTDGLILEYGVSVIDTYDPVPTSTRIFPSRSLDGSRMLVTHLSGSSRMYSVYDFEAFKTRNFTPLYTFPSPAGVVTLQSCVLHGDYVYLYAGDAFSGGNPSPGNTFHIVIDIRTGLEVERVLEESQLSLSYREPEGSTVYLDVTGPQLVFVFTTPNTNPRSFTILSRGLQPQGAWDYTTNTVDEAPFAWNSLMQRYRLARGISTIEVTPGQYEEVRFESYTDELDTLAAGLHFFRGGYAHVVDDQVRSDLIASGVATSLNFTPA